ncbi:hypothetical protein ACH5RR_028980 [Cinchona calisaya]|uniref:Receptor-like serine/threonine-protein kinase n=1 Tax=Cinchona calisaya TaxID=153742 RepID=A0ABD2YQC5_9GENT
MQPATIPLFFCVLVALFWCNFQSCVARDTITINSSLPDNGTTLVSAGKIFELGYFYPNNNINGGRYVGIWYHKLRPRTVVWVANRNAPLLNQSGFFVIDEDGNVKLLDEHGDSHFHTNLVSSNLVYRTLKLLDSGNLALIDGQSGKYLWQSFAEPTDTFLPGMKMDEKLNLRSWKDYDDPANGEYTFHQDQDNGVHKIMKGSVQYWRSDQSGSSELPLSVAAMLSNSSSKLNPSAYNASGRLLMNSSGEIQFYSLEQDVWSLIWSEPSDVCSVFNPCGNFGSCNIRNGSLNCQCLQGFVLVSPETYSTGCRRMLAICTSKPDTFLFLVSMEVVKPEIVSAGADSEDTCRKECLRNCKCQAYYYSAGNKGRSGTNNAEAGCLIWTSMITNLRDYKGGGLNLNLSIRVAGSSTATVNNSNQPEAPILQSIKPSMNRETVIIVTTVIAVVLLAGSFSSFFFTRRILAKRKESKEIILGNATPYLEDSERQAEDLVNEDDKIVDVPYFSLESILAATDNFSDANKLGHGGFGPVYKAMFPGEKELAVKRLSSHSGQGMVEFRNEVVLIAKLQHRNLVRLLGYCIKGSERILLYEYMPNKSLDTFIFDQERHILLDWNMRYDIILGIARGLLYLHHDSRLRIIHRDLKTSNILLDKEMNPKISDFGLARVVEGKETEANTMKVVGTYGYMSPEYAIEGLFSIKSDVFSFGVIILEIISGKRTTGFYHSEEALSLLGYAWRLWQERNAMELVDKKLLESCNGAEVMKCINIGLLCVQEDPSDRPAMPNVVIMLSRETTTLPSPNQPAYVARRRISGTSSLSSKAETSSMNRMTISVEEGR